MSQLGVRGTKTSALLGPVPYQEEPLHPRCQRCLHCEHWRAGRVPRQRGDRQEESRQGELRPGDRDHTSFPMEAGFIHCKPTRSQQGVARPALWSDRSDVEDGAEAEHPETRRPGEHLDGCGKSSGKSGEEGGGGGAAGRRREGCVWHSACVGTAHRWR